MIDLLKYVSFSFFVKCYLIFLFWCVCLYIYRFVIVCMNGYTYMCDCVWGEGVSQGFLLILQFPLGTTFFRTTTVHVYQKTALTIISQVVYVFSLLFNFSVFYLTVLLLPWSLLRRLDQLKYQLQVSTLLPQNWDLKCMPLCLGFSARSGATIQGNHYFLSHLINLPYNFLLMSFI